MSEQPGDPRGTAPFSRVQPTDLVTEVQGMVGPGGMKMVGLRIESSVGSFMFLIPPDLAENTGALMVQAGRSAQSGLIVPPGLKV